MRRARDRAGGDRPGGRLGARAGERRGGKAGRARDAPRRAITRSRTRARPTSRSTPPRSSRRRRPRSKAPPTPSRPPPSDAEDDEKARAEFQRIAERRVRLGLLLAEVGRNNNITVSQEEVNQALIAGSPPPSRLRAPGHRLLPPEPGRAGQSARADLRGQGRRLHRRAGEADRAQGHAAGAAGRRRTEDEEERERRRKAAGDEAAGRRSPRRYRGRPVERRETWPTISNST